MITARGAVAARSRLGAFRADLVLGWRLAVRHPVSRAAVGWAVGLAGLTRLAAGPAPDAAAPLLVSLAGLLAAAAGPRGFVRGGPLESFRWIGVAPSATVLARLGGTVAVACAGAVVAAAVVAGPRAVGVAALGAAVAHAAVIGALTGGLTPALGCTAATTLALLLVAVGVGAPYAALVLEAGLPVAPLRPPGALALGLAEGYGLPDALGLAAWAALGTGGVLTLARRVPRRRALGTPPEPASLECRGVTCVALTGESPRRILDDVTLTVESAEIVALVGVPVDGPGTLLRVAARVTPVSSGTVAVRTGRSPAPRGFGYVRAGITGPPELSAVEWLRYVADHRGGTYRARTLRVQAALGLVNLGASAGRRIGLLDRNHAERLGVATGAVSGAAVIMLDDCFAGVDAGTRQALTDALADLAAQGRTILLAPRDVRAVEAIATRVVVLRDGRVLADLRMTALQRERVAELRLNGAALASVARITAHFPDAVRTGIGVDIPLAGGRTLETVLALCRSERIPVIGSRIRYRAVEDLLAPGRPAPEPERAALFG